MCERPRKTKTVTGRTSTESILLNLGLQTNCGICMVAEACNFVQLQGK